MKKFRNTGPMNLRRVIGSLLSQRRILPILVAAGLLPATATFGITIDFTPLDPPPEGPGYGGSESFASGTFGTAVYSTINTHPAGTGVFDPFLTYQRKGTEEGVNTSQFGNGQGILDDKRVPQWTHDLLFGSLGVVNDPKNGVPSIAFELDANETGTGNINRLLSIDQLVVTVTESSPFTAGMNNSAARNAVAGITTAAQGLVYRQNATFSSTANWVLIDASRSEGGSTSGSGSSDMIVYIPVSLFTAAGADADDFVTFYTLNGVHDASGDGTDINGSSSEAGFEEWRAVQAVPDGGGTLLLLGSALIPLGLLRARREMSNKA